jgi:xanthine dehydrogenase YagS FAD-binding subunit
MCVALAALGAIVTVEGQDGPREIPLVDLHRLPGETPEVETVLKSGELITAVTLRPNGFSDRSSYRKVRDRASYAFALVSVAAGLELSDGKINDARLALGGIAHKPWRAEAAEAVLKGRPATEAVFREAAEAELAPAKGLKNNAFKIDLAKRVIVDSFVKLASAPETCP